MTRRKRILVATGGGDCPGLNAVLRAIVKKATGQHNWEVLGSIDAFNGVLSEPMSKGSDLAAVGIHAAAEPSLAQRIEGVHFTGRSSDQTGRGAVKTGRTNSFAACSTKVLRQ
jgi:6-phosphofructokinase 1